jgi:hypothetical protein
VRIQPCFDDQFTILIALILLEASNRSLKH